MESTIKTLSALSDIINRIVSTGQRRSSVFIVINFTNEISIKKVPPYKRAAWRMTIDNEVALSVITR
jgi:hypothetical protein